MKPLALLAAALLAVLALTWWWNTDRAIPESAQANPVATATNEAGTLALERPTETPPQRTEEREAVATPIAAAAEASPSAPIDPPYESWSLEDLIREEKSLRSTLSEQSGPLLQAEVDAGRAEVLSETTAFQYASRPGDNAEVFGLHSIPDRGAFRPSLSRADFPEIYAIKDHLLRVKEVIRQREIAAALPR